MLEPKAPPVWNGTNTGSLAPGVRKRVKKNYAMVLNVYNDYQHWQLTPQFDYNLTLTGEHS